MIIKKRVHFIINLQIMYFSLCPAQFCFRGASSSMEGLAFILGLLQS